MTHAVISAVSHEGLTVTVDGKPGQLAIVTEEGEVIASGALVAREIESVAVNRYRELLIERGCMRVMSREIP